MTDTAIEQLVEFDLLIGGESSSAASGSTFDSIDPFTGRPWARVPDGGAADMDRAVAAARAALNGPWDGFCNRPGELLLRLGEIIAREAVQLAELEVRDGGKLVRKWSARCGRCRSTLLLRRAGGQAQGNVMPVDQPNYFVYTRHEPVGVVGAITPWNSPLLFLTWKLAAGLARVIRSSSSPATTPAPRHSRSRSCSPRPLGRPGSSTSSPAAARGRCCAGVAPGCRQDRVHRIDDRQRPSGGQGRDRQHDPVLARTRRQVGAGGVRRYRAPRPRGQRGDRRRFRRHRPDLSGRLTAVGAREHRRRGLVDKIVARAATIRTG